MTPSLWRSAITGVQHRAALALGVDEQRRAETVLAMLANNRRRAPGYWIQLSLAMGIATLGLVLDSTAVVIGAMLVSPLMGPILELGMGFAVGSSFLALSAFLRVLLSVVTVVAGAAVLTLLLPFHEITSEIAARAAPTALDLLVAAFCALTAAYTTVRATSDTTSAAAGTAIGIALVPPLCAVGFGLGTGTLAVASGAALLFTANLSAILVLSVLSFLILGYNQVNAERVEHDSAGADGTRADLIAVRVETALHRAFGSRYGFAMRLLVPMTFLAAVYIPLRRALNEVTWEVRARDAIRRIVGGEAPSAVQTAVTVERHTVTIHLLVVSSLERARALEQTIRARIVSSTGVVPDVAVTAVPDAATLAAVATARSTAGSSAKEQPIDLAVLRGRLTAAIDAVWPTAAAGPPLGWQLIVDGSGAPTVAVHHLGTPLGTVAEALLGRSLSTRLGTTVVVTAMARDSAILTAPLGRESQWLTAVRPGLEWLAGADRAAACIRGPVASTRRLTARQRQTLDAVRSSAAARGGRVTLGDSAGWRLRIVTGRCPGADSAVAADTSRTRTPP